MTAKSMKAYDEEDWLIISGLQAFVYCRRQWALREIEKQYEENYWTVDGDIFHERVHGGEEIFESRGDCIVVRGMPVHSRVLGLSGQCDVVEFKKAPQGISLRGRDGLYAVCPVEYKRGSPKEGNADALQLAAQAFCLEEMLCCEIGRGYLYYGEKRRRTEIVFTESLRQEVFDACREMHMLFEKRHTPKVRPTSKCRACSLKDICLPALGKSKSASEYIARNLSDTEGSADEKAP